MRRTVMAAFRDERGIALPMAMVVLLMLTALTFAFSTLGTTEPVISRNHSMTAQARAYAESGLERAIWAMSFAAPTFASTAAGAEADAPYNGSQLQTISASGGFTVRLVNGSDPDNLKLVTAVGWAPDSTGQVRAAKKVEATIMRFPLAKLMPPCALCVNGSLDIGGNANISSWTGSTGVVHCSTPPTGGTMTTGATARRGSASVRGPDDSSANELEDMPQLQPSSSIPKLSTDDLDALRAIAKMNGTYYQGAVNFTNGNPLPPQGGIVFIDTTTGTNLTATTPSGEAGSASISANQTWSGMIIAMGDINISGTVSLTGAIYAMNDFVFTGNGSITGAVLAENKSLTVHSTVDSSTTGTSNITYDCPAFQNAGGKVAQRWFMKPGTFRENSGK